MQRRQQLHPNQPYISLPSNNSPTMGSLSFSSPSSSRRGKTHLALSVLHPPPSITLIHFLLSRLLIDTKLLQRRSKSQELPQLKRTCQPFDFCPSYSPGDKIGTKYGTVTLSKSRMHLGSGARIQRVLNKALAGQSVTISVLGGSGMPFSLSSFYTSNSTYERLPPVSACHGAGDDPISPTCYPSRFFQWWNTVFPHPATELTNGALRRTNSGYFGYCNSHHLPDQTDLVIIELDTEDEPCVSFFSFVSLPFLSNHPFLFASIRYRSVATALRPLYFMPSYRHLNDGLSHTKQW